MFLSAKFEFLNQKWKFIKIPRTQLIESDKDLPNDSGIYVMRSALADEAQSRLHSGKSISIFPIIGQSKLKHAYNQILEQENLKEVIVQQYIEHNIHLTIYLRNDFAFIESKHQGIIAHHLTSKIVKYGDHQILKDIAEFIKRNKLAKNKAYLLEMGINSGDLFLFQCQMVNEKVFQRIFDSSMSMIFIKDALRWRGNRKLSNKIKDEFNAIRFRNKQQFLYPEDSFKNWYFLLHYYQLYSTVMKSSPSAENFLHFIQSPPPHLKQQVHKHLALANQIKKESMNYNSLISKNLSSTSPRFYGPGCITASYSIYKDHEFDLIYTEKPKLVLSNTNSLLSHLVLACLENEIPLVTGLSEQFLNTLPLQDEITVDFDNMKILIESTVVMEV